MIKYNDIISSQLYGELSDVDLFAKDLKPIITEYGATYKEIYVSSFEDKQFYPCGIAIIENNIYVADCAGNEIHMFDNEGKWLGKFGNGFLCQPCGIATNNNHIYVTNMENKKIQIFHHNGEYIGGIADGPSCQDINMLGITIQDHIYTTDNYHNKIQIFDFAGKHIGSVASHGKEDGQIIDPRDILVSGQQIYITDRFNQRIQIFSKIGKYINKFGIYGSGDGMFKNPYNMATKDGNLYVTDYGNDRVQVFSLDGNYMRQFNTNNYPYGIAMTGDLIYITSNFGGTIKIYKTVPE